MRIALIGMALTLASVAGCSEPASKSSMTPTASPDAAPQVAAPPTGGGPVRKAGWWEVTNVINAGPAWVVHSCVDPASEALSGLSPPSAPGEGCSSTAPRRTAKGWEFSVTCKLSDSIDMQTEGVISGDLETSYRLDIFSKVTPPMPGMKDSKVEIQGRWLGACPAGRKPGETVGADGEIVAQGGA
jgi:hypothetical protein